MAAGSQDPAWRARIGRIENGFPRFGDRGSARSSPPTLPALMDLYRVPGLSIAIIDDFQLQWSNGYGVLRAGSPTAAQSTTLFQTGSISKPVGAATALRLVEDGHLSLTAPVNEALQNWKLPVNEFVSGNPVTLRHLLSHTAGTTVAGFPGYSREDSAPTLIEILDGVPPANTGPVRVDTAPGSRWRYSGGGYLVAQQLVVDVSGRSFPTSSQSSVFEPLGMADSTFEQPLPANRAGSCASGHLWKGEGVPGGWHVYPEMAAAGLWSTAPDLARFSVRIALARRGEDESWISRKTAELMTTPQAGPVTDHIFGSEAHPDQMGLGLFVGGTDRADLFGHIGSNEGYQGLLQMSSRTGQGLVVLTNSQIGLFVALLLRSQIARELGWRPPFGEGRFDAEILTDLLVTVEAGGVEAGISRYFETKAVSSAPEAHYRESLIALGYLLAYRGAPKGSVEVLKLCVAENPKYWNAHDSLGEVYAMLGDRTAAIDCYRRSLELNPENRSGQTKLDELEAARGATSATGPTDAAAR